MVSNVMDYMLLLLLLLLSIAPLVREHDQELVAEDLFLLLA